MRAVAGVRSHAEARVCRVFLFGLLTRTRAPNGNERRAAVRLLR
jgi:hypothetical protein